MSQLLQVKPAGSKTDSQKSKPNITFHIVSGKFKENIEEGGKEMDPYVKLKIGSQEYKTDVHAFFWQLGGFGGGQVT
jgi:hypothetical protein